MTTGYIPIVRTICCLGSLIFRVFDVNRLNGTRRNTTAHRQMTSMGRVRQKLCPLAWRTCGHRRSSRVSPRRAYGATCAEFSWQGYNGADEACGRGWYRLGAVGRLFQGDDLSFFANTTEFFNGQLLFLQPRPKSSAITPVILASTGVGSRRAPLTPPMRWARRACRPNEGEWHSL